MNRRKDWRDELADSALDVQALILEAETAVVRSRWPLALSLVRHAQELMRRGVIAWTEELRRGPALKVRAA